MKIKKLLSTITKHYGARYRIVKLKEDEEGAYVLGKKLILISKKYLFNFQRTLSTLFHELGHHHCILNNKFVTYHKRPKTITNNRFKKIATIALRAELYVDKWGEKEFKRWFPKSKYYQCYRSKEEKEWLKNSFK